MRSGVPPPTSSGVSTVSRTVPALGALGRRQALVTGDAARIARARQPRESTWYQSVSPTAGARATAPSGGADPTSGARVTEAVAESQVIELPTTARSSSAKSLAWL